MPAAQDSSPDALAALLRGHFDAVYVVNLPSRADRRREMNAELRRVGLALDDGFVRLFNAVRPDGPGKFANLGEHGCFLSHHAILKAAREAGQDRVLILEDDFNFAPDIGRLLRPVLEALAAEPWGHARLGNLVHDAPDASPGVVRVPPGQALIATHCIAWRGEAMQRADEFLDLVLSREPGDPAGGPMPVDGAFNTLADQQPDLAVYRAVPTLGHQRSSRSDITRHGLERVPGVANVLDVARRLRRAIRGGR